VEGISEARLITLLGRVSLALAVHPAERIFSRSTGIAGFPENLIRT